MLLIDTFSIHLLRTNPCHAEFILGKLKICCIFCHSSTLRWQVVEIIPRGKQWYVSHGCWYPSIHNVLMLWPLELLGYPQPWENISLSSMEDDFNYRKTSSISSTKSQNLNVSCIRVQLSSLNLLTPGVKLRMKMYLEQRREAMLQLHLSYQQFYCLLRCDLY